MSNPVAPSVPQTLNADTATSIPRSSLSVSPFFSKFPREVRNLIYAEAWLLSPSINLGGLRYMFGDEQTTSHREPGVLDFERRPTGKYPLWFAASSQFSAEATQQAQQMGIARVEPGQAINGGAWPRPGYQNTEARVLRIQYPISYLNPWLMPKLTVHDFIKTKEFPRGPRCGRGGILGVSHKSWTELVSILPMPRHQTPKVQCMELRIKIGLYPGNDYTAYDANFSTLETLSVSSLTEMSISIDFTAHPELEPSSQIAWWTPEETEEWKELMVIIFKEEVERVARKMLGGTWLYESWETIMEPDDLGQFAVRYTVKK